jgi:hypothetical protein
MREEIDKQATIMTDDFQAYRSLGTNLLAVTITLLMELGNMFAGIFTLIPQRVLSR